MPEQSLVMSETVKKIWKSRGSLEQMFPDNLEPNLIDANLMQNCKASEHVRKGIEKVNLAIGRLLKLAKANPETWEGIDGVENFEGYKKHIESKTGMARSTLGNCMYLYDRWPSLTLGEFEKIGTANLLFVSTFCDQSEKGHMKVLAAASEKKLVDLKQWAVDEGYVYKGDTKGANLIVTGSKKDVNDLSKFLARPEVQAVVGSGKAIKILLAMMEECSAEWLDKGQKILDKTVVDVEAEPAEA